MNVLITGAAGFIGYRLIEKLKDQHRLIGVDQLSHFKTRMAEHNSVPEMTLIDRDALWEWLQEHQPVIDVIFHLGACTDTTELDVNYLNKINLDYSKKLWSYATEKRIPFIYASSAATYGAGENGYDDDESLIHCLKPLNPYGQSKQSFDLWVLEQERNGFTPPAWCGFKFFNVYGYGERHKGKMASVILHSYDQVLTHGKVKLFKSHKPGIADGQQKRDFIYVEDVVDVLWFAYQKPLKRGIYNLGSGEARSFLDLVKCVFHEMEKTEHIDFIDTPLEIRERYQYFTQANMARLKHAGYAKPFTSLEKGVQQYLKRLKT